MKARAARHADLRCLRVSRARVRRDSCEARDFGDLLKSTSLNEAGYALHLQRGRGLATVITATCVTLGFAPIAADATSRLPAGHGVINAPLEES